METVQLTSLSDSDGVNLEGCQGLIGQALFCSWKVKLVGGGIKVSFLTDVLEYAGQREGGRYSYYSPLTLGQFNL